MSDEKSPGNAAAAKQLVEERSLKEKSHADYEQRRKSRPTPTQEENDLAALGAHFHEHEDDGSGPDPHATKQSEARKPASVGGGYSTPQSQPAGRPSSS